MSAEFTGYLIALAAVMGSIITFLQWRSKGVFVDPEVLTTLQKRADDQSARLDDEIAKRRALERNAHKTEIKADKLDESLKKTKTEASKLADRLDIEIKARQKLQEKARLDRNRILSLEQNDAMNQKHLEQLHQKLDDWSKGINILIAQIENRHNSKPDWRPDE